MKKTSKYVFECPPQFMEKPSMGLIATLIEKGYRVMYISVDNATGSVNVDNVAKTIISNITDFFVKPIENETEAAFIVYFKVKAREKDHEEV